MAQADDALSFTAPSLMEFGLIDEIVREPLGGEPRPHKLYAILIKKSLRNNLLPVSQVVPAMLTKQRHEKF